MLFEESKKLVENKFSKKGNFSKIFKKIIKLTFTSSFLIVLVFIGIMSFYIVVDSLDNKSLSSNLSEISKNKFKTSSEKNLNDIEKNEIERESEKANSIFEKNEGEGYEFDPKFYDFTNWNKTCSKELMIVNCENKLPEDFVVETKICRGKEVSSIIADDLEKMITDAKKDGVNLWISSGYRSVSRQAMLFDRQVEKQKSKSKSKINEEDAQVMAAKVVAKPATSEHNIGLAVDFNGVKDDFYQTKEYKWLMDNAHKYGFIERYQEKWKNKTGVIYEPWHFRYVGIDNAKSIKESGLCLEDYVKTKIIEKNSEE